MSGWYITQTVAPAGTVGAGKACTAVMLNGEFQQGFRAGPLGVLQARSWGLLNAKGWLPCR